MPSTGATAEPQPLSAEDRAILALERGPIVGHTCKVIASARRPGRRDLSRRAHRRGAPRADRRPPRRRARSAAPPRWQPGGAGVGRGPWLDLAEHVVDDADAEPLDAAAPASRGRPALRGAPRPRAARSGESTSCRSPTAAPPSSGGSTTRWPTARPACDSPTRCSGTRRKRPRPPAAHHRAAAADDARRRAHLAGFVHREFARSQPLALRRHGRRAAASSTSRPCRSRRFTTPPRASPARP